MEPKNVKEYFKECFVFDIKAGFITAIVAIPLAIAFAIASGVQPILGLYTAIIAGILGSMFGGSKFSITGPTGAMTVVILSIMNKYGLEGLLLTGFLAGALQVGLGLIKLGKLVKFIPLPIISGFTAGIGVIIFFGQVPNALGLNIPAKEHIWETFFEIIKQLAAINPISILIASATILILVFMPKFTSKTKYFKAVPPSVIALALSTLAVILMHINVPLVGKIPSGLPTFSLIKFNLDLLKEVLPSALTIAFLGVIESLLCAVVCDGMSNSKHDSDKELIGQGITNMVLPFFGTIPATAAIARSAVNIREGAKTKYAGVIHSIFILIILLFFGPVAQYIPKSFLAGILMFVSFNMINLREFKTIIDISRSEATVLFITFGLTVFTDLVFAVQVGMMLAIFLIFIKLTNIINISPMEDYDAQNGINHQIYSNPVLKDKVSVYTIHGPFFFGAMSVFDRKVSEHLGIKKQNLILRMKHVSFVDSTALVRLNSFIKNRQKGNYRILMSGLRPEVKKKLFKDEEFSSLMCKHCIFNRTHEALEYLEKEIKGDLSSSCTCKNQKS